MFYAIVIVAVTLYALYVYYRSHRISHFSDKYVLITGCDSGFGFLLAQKLDSLGINVFAGCLTTEGQEQLRNKTSSHVTVLSLDVTKETNIKDAYQEVVSRLPADQGLWAVVNNAGIFGPVGVTDWFILDDYRKVMEVDLYGMIEINRIFLPLIRKCRGRIINMTSIVGRIGLGGSPYVAAKYAAEGYSDVLRRELLNSRVSVHIIEPGPFKTNISNVERMVESLHFHFNRLDDNTKAYFGTYFFKELERLTRLSLSTALSPRLQKVVDAYTHAITAKYPKARYLVGLDAQYLYPIMWNLPEFISDYLFAFMMPLPEAVQHHKQ